MRTSDFPHYDTRRWPCKIGTIPATVRVRKNERFEPGRWIRIQEVERGPWVWVKVNTVNEDGHFQADR